MQLIHEWAGMIIAVVGVLFVVLARPIPRQVTRWHIHAIEDVEPGILMWLSRSIGVSLVFLGVVTWLSSM